MAEVNLLHDALWVWQKPVRPDRGGGALAGVCCKLLLKLTVSRLCCDRSEEWKRGPYSSMSGR